VKKTCLRMAADGQLTTDPYGRYTTPPLSPKPQERPVPPTANTTTSATSHDRRTTVTKLLLTADEAAEIVGIGRAKVYELLRLGQIESVRIGRRSAGFVMSWRLGRACARALVWEERGPVSSTRTGGLIGQRNAHRSWTRILGGRA